MKVTGMHSVLCSTKMVPCYRGVSSGAIQDGNIVLGSPGSYGIPVCAQESNSSAICGGYGMELCLLALDHLVRRVTQNCSVSMTKMTWQFKPASRRPEVNGGAFIAFLVFLAQMKQVLGWWAGSTLQGSRWFASTLSETCLSQCSCELLESFHNQNARWASHRHIPCLPDGTRVHPDTNGSTYILEMTFEEQQRALPSFVQRK